jgi:hypothetical protein
MPDERHAKAIIDRDIGQVSVPMGGVVLVAK